MVKTPKNKNETVRFGSDIPPDLADQAMECFGSRGLGRSAAIERILTWFVSAPEAIQAGVLGHLPASMMADLPRYVAEEIARTDDTGSASDSDDPD